MGSELKPRHEINPDGIEYLNFGRDTNPPARPTVRVVANSQRESSKQGLYGG